ncbi:MAG: permease-like cell division protein FtsX [bacterium]|nr:permease-like cell division protein FtsX [bacterium]
MFITFSRVIKFAFQNFVRNIWLAIATIFIITLSLLSVNFFILANAFMDTALQGIEDKINITVYFNPVGQEAQFLSLADRLRALPEVAHVDYISKDDALVKLKARYANQGNTALEDSLKELDVNPLTPSLVVQAKKLDDYAAIQSTLAEQQYETLIEKKEFFNRSSLIEKIHVLKNNIQKAALYVNIFFLIIAALIITNTIRITIYTRRREVGIMKLVGATNWFIRAPLYVESIIYSVAGTVLTILILFPILGAMQPYIERFFDGQAFDVLGYFSTNFLTIFGYEFLAALVLSMLSSGLAIGKYLRV